MSTKLSKKLLSITAIALMATGTAAHAQQEVKKQVYDFVVPDNGSFGKAIHAANTRKDVKQRFRIFVRQGHYVIPASTTKTIEGMDGRQYPDPRTDLNAGRVSIIGEGLENTSITNTCPDTTVSTKCGLHAL